MRSSVAGALSLLPLLASGVGIEELRAASEELQEGTLDDEGLRIFRQHAAQHPHDWRAHGMLGQALAQKSLPGAIDALREAQRLAPTVPEVALALGKELVRDQMADAPAEAAHHLHSALLLKPALGDVDTYVQLGVAASGSTEAYGETTLSSGDGSDAAVEAWRVAAALAPDRVDIALMLAKRLASGGKEQRREAVRAAEKAIGLAPQSASAYDALAAALLTSSSLSELKKKQSARLQGTLRVAIRLRGDGTSEEDRVQTATAHDLLARSLGKFEDLPSEETPSWISEDTMQRMTEAVHHTRQAARLDPTRFRERAKLLHGWEDALRDYKQAEHRDGLQREAMVKAIYTPFEEKRLQEEEDRAIAEEAANERGH